LKEVKYESNFDKLKLGKLNPKELNILFTVLFALRDKSTDEVTFKFSEFKELANLDRGNKNLFQNIDNFFDKIIKSVQTFELEDEIIKINLFRVIKINKKTKEVYFAISEEFKELIDSLLGNYTQLDLKNMVALKSKYSKRAFKILKEFDMPKKRNTLFIRTEEFLEKMEFSSNFTRVEISLYLSKVIQELEDVFKNLNLLKLNSKQEPVIRGQKAKYYQFTWDGKDFFDKQKKSTKETIEFIVKGEINFNNRTERISKDEEKQGQNELKIMDFEIAKNSFKLGLIKHFLESNSLINGELNLGDINKLNETLKQLKCQEVEIKKQETGYIILLE